MRPKLARTTWAVSIALTLLAIVYVGAMVVAQAYFEGPSPDVSTYNSGKNGAQAYYLYLSRLGYRVSRLEQFDQIPRRPRTLVLVTPLVRDPMSAEVRLIRNWVGRGGRLVLIGPGTSEIHSTFGVRSGDSGSGRRVARPVQPGALVRSVSRVMPGSRARFWSDATNVTYLSDAAGAVLVARDFRKGTVVAMAANYPIRNDGILRDDHPALAANLAGPAGSAVVFDEYHHGYSTAPGPFGLMSPSSRYAWALLAAACVLFLYGWGKRPGPALAYERPVGRRVTEYAYSLGALFESAGARAEVARMLATGLARRTSRRPGKGGRELEEMHRLIAELGERAGAGYVSQQEIAQLGRRAYEARMGVERIGKGRRGKRVV